MTKQSNMQFLNDINLSWDVFESIKHKPKSFSQKTHQNNFLRPTVRKKALRLDYVSNFENCIKLIRLSHPFAWNISF